MGKILSISLKLNFSPNTSGCYGLKSTVFSNPISTRFALIDRKIIIFDQKKQTLYHIRYITVGISGKEFIWL